MEDKRSHFNKLDWSSYQVGLAIEKSGSILGAANILHTSPQTVRRRLDRIESVIGAKLFERLSTGYVATPTGEVFLETAREFELVWARSDAKMKSLHSTKGLRLVVSTGISITLAVIQRQLGEFQKAHPEIQLEILTTNTIVDLSLRQADVAIRPDGCTRRTADLYRRHLCDVGFGIYGSKTYLEKNGLPKNFDDIKNHDLVVHSREELYYFEPMNWVTDQCQPRSVPLLTNNVLSMLEAAKQDVGLAILPCALADQHQELKMVIGGFQEMNMPLCVYMHKEVRKNPEVVKFINFYSRWAKKNASALQGPAPAPARHSLPE